jgi:hypothetical protein
LLVHLLDIRPAFQGNALEDGEKGVQNIIKISHAKVRVFVLLTAEGSIRARLATTADNIIFKFDTRFNIDAALLQ